MTANLSTLFVTCLVSGVVWMNKAGFTSVFERTLIISIHWLLNYISTCICGIVLYISYMLASIACNRDLLGGCCTMAVLQTCDILVIILVVITKVKLIILVLVFALATKISLLPTCVWITRVLNVWWSFAKFADECGLNIIWVIVIDMR